MIDDNATLLVILVVVADFLFGLGITAAVVDWFFSQLVQGLVDYGVSTGKSILDGVVDFGVSTGESIFDTLNPF